MHHDENSYYCLKNNITTILMEKQTKNKTHSWRKRKPNLRNFHILARAASCIFIIANFPPHFSHDFFEQKQGIFYYYLLLLLFDIYIQISLKTLERYPACQLFWKENFSLQPHSLNILYDPDFWTLIHKFLAQPLLKILHREIRTIIKWPALSPICRFLNLKNVRWTFLEPKYKKCVNKTSEIYNLFAKIREKRKIHLDKMSLLQNWIFAEIAKMEVFSHPGCVATKCPNNDKIIKTTDDHHHHP